MIYVLDAGPVFALFDSEPGVEVVEDVLTEPDSVVYIHIFNLVEIYYIYIRRGGVAAAETALNTLLGLGVIIRDDHDTEYWKNAATFKGNHALSLPDAFCLALAQRLGATAVTTDRAEFGPACSAWLLPHSLHSLTR